MSEDLGPGFGGVVGGAPPGVVDQRRQRGLARDAAGYLEEGEMLLAPAAFGTQGGGIFVLSGAGVLAAIMVTLVVAGDRMGAAADVVFGAGLALAVLLVVLSVPFARGCAVVLTDRRLLVFRTGRLSPRVREMIIAVPRGEVSASLWALQGYGALSLEFSPAVGRAPMKPYFMGPGTWAARCIDDALATAAGGADASPQPGKAA